MHQGHSVKTGVRTIFESSPPKSLRKPVHGVQIEIDRDNWREKPEEIEALLASIEDPGAVRLLQIDPACHLTRVPSAAARFVNLEYAHVSGRRIRDFSPLFELRKIKSLFVIGLRGGPALREVSIYASLKDTNIDELKRTTTLKRAYIQLPAKRLAEIGIENPGLTISNGTDCFKDGKKGVHFGDFHPE